MHAKPRMTRSDKWKKRPTVENYRAYKDVLNVYKSRLPDIKTILHLYYLVEMPKSWSDKNKEKMFGQFHQNKPDIDNALKAVMDSLLKEDQSVAVGLVTKIWSYENTTFFFGYKLPTDLRGRLGIHLQQMPGLSDCPEGSDIVDPGEILYAELQRHQQSYHERKARIKNDKRSRSKPGNTML